MLPNGFAHQENADENTPIEERYFQIFGDGVGPHILSPFSGPGEWTDEVGLSKYDYDTFFAVLYCNRIILSMPHSVLY